MLFRSTGFIAEHYPKGFNAADVPHDDPAFLAALATYAYRRTRLRAAGISGQLPGHRVHIGSRFVVVEADDEGNKTRTPVTIEALVDDGFKVEAGGKTFEIKSDWRLRDPLMQGTCNGEPFCAQVERHVLRFRISHNGKTIDAMVLSERAAELDALMPFKAPPDLSKFLLSPMPGLLTQIAVAPGQLVRAGERLATIEAMKMENALFATQDCTVAELLAKQGESLAVDQPIIRFQ